MMADVMDGEGAEITGQHPAAAVGCGQSVYGAFRASSSQTRRPGSAANAVHQMFRADAGAVRLSFGQFGKGTQR